MISPRCNHGSTAHQHVITAKVKNPAVMKVDCTEFPFFSRYLPFSLSSLYAICAIYLYIYAMPLEVHVEKSMETVAVLAGKKGVCA